ncbi:hypothetical protein L0664_00825 [Octadecabacter sp. G9-8]|uniref:Porin n=1 Tax=Octadecabacter dasysiphoniae TaxID=2909341 RepID=A0ABS9CT58_9RHOB|nr:hypothetical protein [Octadecabacter dasysiphoniae]MCF2869594.1 hypothetical protein [Octadecabacter dasysiphoniae]
MLIRIATVAATGIFALTATGVTAETTLSYGSYLEYDYDYEDSDEEIIVGSYLEVEANSGIFAGLELYTVEDDPDDYAYDFSVGFRGDAGTASYEIAYYNYNLNESGSDGEEIAASIGYAALGMDLTSSLTSDLEGAYAIGQDFDVPLPSDYTFGFGFEAATDSDELDWDVSLAKQLTDTVSLSGGFSGDTGSENPETFFAVSFDTSTILN